MCGIFACVNTRSQLATHTWVSETRLLLRCGEGGEEEVMGNGEYDQSM